jgi:alanyl-tRNA synthetase
MLTGIDKNEVREYVSQFDKSDSPTIFLVGNIPNAKKMSLIGNVINSDGGVNVKELQARIAEITRAGLRGIKNFVRPGTNKASDITDVSDDVIEELPVEVLYEVAGKIIEFNFVSATERKNS